MTKTDKVIYLHVSYDFSNNVKKIYCSETMTFTSYLAKNQHSSWCPKEYS